MSIFKTSAISIIVSKDGYISLVHHIETVAAFLPTLSANPLLVLLRSASTTLSLFIDFLTIIICEIHN